MLLLLIASGRCYFCAHSFEIGESVKAPQHFNIYVRDGETICVNSSVPRLLTVFEQGSLFSVRYFRMIDGVSTPQGKFYFPSEQAGFKFDAELGHFEIQAYLNGNISFSTFPFPIECKGNRFVTTLDKEEFQLGQKFQPQSGFACLWNPRDESSLYELKENHKEIQLCDAKGCKSNKGERERLTRTSYIKIDLADPGFVNSFTVKLQSYKQDRPSWFLISGNFDDDGLDRILVQDEDEITTDTQDVSIEEPKQPIVKADRLQPERRQEPANLMGTLMMMQIISIITVIIMCVLVFVQCFFCRAFGKAGHDESEMRLLDGHEEDNPALRSAGDKRFGVPPHVIPETGSEQPLVGASFPSISST